MKTVWISLLVLLVFTLTGCGAAQADPFQADSPDLQSPSPSKQPISTLIPAQPPQQGDATQMNPVLPTPSVPGIEGLIETAKKDLAQRLSIPASDIVLLDAKEVVWSDSSLGCPQPNMMYTQVLTPGYLIKLKYDIREYEYHAGLGGALTYCKNPLPPSEGVPSNT